MKKLFLEFQTFIARGNVADLAVGVIIGSAFTAIVTALVTNIIAPLIGLAMQALIGGDFSGMAFKIGNVEFAYGNVIAAIVNFLITALVVFFLVKAINHAGRLKKADTPEKETVFICPFCRSAVDKEAVKCPGCTADMTPLAVEK